MTETKSTKRALLASVVALMLCIAMLLGTTYAWFTDSVTSSGNIIKSGTLDVAMEWAEGDENPATATWTDASTGAIFNNELWEPGYTEARHIKISNNGTLALKYELKIVANGEVSELADVIDVYSNKYGAVQVTSRDKAESLDYVGTLSEVLSTGILTGELQAEKATTRTIVLKMRESAGNEYQNLAIGADFAVQLNATQLASETDSFDKDYDKNAGKTVVTPDTAQAAIDAAEAGDVISLGDGHYDALVAKDGIVIEGQGGNSYVDCSVASINLNSAKNVTIKNVAFDMQKAEEVYKKDGSSAGYVASIVGAKSGANTGAENIVIDNCTFKATGNPASNYVPICFEEQGRPTSRATDITVIGCKADRQVFNFVRMNYMAEGTITIKNNSVPLGTAHSTLNFTSNAADLMIRGNSFARWNSEKAMLGTSYNANNKVNIEVTGNTIKNNLTGEGVVLDIKPTYTKANCNVVFSGNTFEGGLEGMTEATVPCNMPK